MRRLVSTASIVIAVVALVGVLASATLVDRKPPTIQRVSLSATAGNDRVGQTLTAIDIQFSEPVQTGSVERRFTITPYVAGSFTWDGSTAIFTPSERLPPDTAFSVGVSPGFQDIAGNAAPTGLEGWRFRTVGPPAVVSTTPTDGATGLAVDGTVSIQFDRLMDTNAVQAALHLDPPVAVRPAWNGDTLTLSFDTSLRFGTTYTLTIDGSAADTGGNRLPAPYTMRFGTVSAGLGTIRSVPADGVSGVSVRSTIALAFDAPIDPTSVAGSIRITPPVSGEIRVADLPDDTQPVPSGGPTPAASGTVLLFVPSSPLASHTTYTVSLAPVVARLGNPSVVAAGRTWTFTTGQPTPSGQNQVAFLSARGGVRNVWLMNPDGTNTRQITTSLVPVSGYDVTADGSTIAWAAGGAITVAGIDGSNERVVTQPGRFESAPTFTPDGHHLVVGRRDASGADLGYWLVPLPGTSGEEVQLLDSGAPPLGSAGIGGDGLAPGPGTLAWAPRAAFDPTGRWLLIGTAGGDVRLVDLGAASGSTPVVTSIGLIAADAPAWVRGPGAFAIVARQPGQQDSSLWLVPTSGPATRSAAAVGGPAVAADGSVALLVTDPSGTVRVAVEQLGGSRTVRLLTTDAGFADRAPAFSPDGSVILFGRVPTDRIDVSAGIWTAVVSTGAIAQLTTDGADPRWLP